MILLWIKDLQPCRGWVTAKISSEFVDLVEHDYWIPLIHRAHALNEAAGHGPHIGSPVTADLGFVTHATKGQTQDLSTQRTGNTPGQ